jgi:hypothetical protein
MHSTSVIRLDISEQVCVCARNPVSQGNACPVLTFLCSLFHLWFHVIIIHFAKRNKERQEKQSVPTLLGLGILMRKPSRASETAKRQRSFEQGRRKITFAQFLTSNHPTVPVRFN